MPPRNVSVLTHNGNIILYFFYFFAAPTKTGAHVPPGREEGGMAYLSIFSSTWGGRRGSVRCLGVEEPDTGLETVGLDVALGVGEGFGVDFGGDDFPVGPLAAG